MAVGHDFESRSNPGAKLAKKATRLQEIVRWNSILKCTKDTCVKNEIKVKIFLLDLQGISSDFFLFDKTPLHMFFFFFDVLCNQ